MENGKKREETVDVSRLPKKLKRTPVRLYLRELSAVSCLPINQHAVIKICLNSYGVLKAQADNVSPFPQVEDFDSSAPATMRRNMP